MEEQGPQATVVARIGKREYPTFITAAGRHTLTADEPTSLGGSDEGPNPYDLLLSALAACKLITVRMYANRKGWALEEARIELSQERVHAKDCEDCESTDGFVHIVRTTLAFDGDLNDEQRDRLLEIADRCPVHKTLTHELKIRSSRAD